MQKINVGCGYGWNTPGWIGIDWDETAAIWKRKDDVSHYINVNILEGIPFSDNSIDIIYTSHMLEHFTYFEAYQVVKEFHRVLKQGGVLSIVVPDLDIYIKKLLEKDSIFLNTPDIIGGVPRDCLTDNFLMNFYSDPSFLNTCHKYAYNFENLTALLKRFGFQKIKKVDFEKFTYCEELNSKSFRCLNEHADQFSLSVECIKGDTKLNYDNIEDYKNGKEIIAQFDKGIMSLRMKLNAANETLQSFKRKDEEYEKTIKDYENKQVDLKDKIKEMDCKIIGLSNKSTQDCERISCLTQELSSTLQNNQMLNEELITIKKSKIWKLTANIRKIKRKFF